MVRSIVEVLCVDCSMFFTERLHPSGMWQEQISAIPVVNACDKKDFGDSAYEHSEIGTGCTRGTDTREQSVVGDTGGSSSSFAVLSGGSSYSVRRPGLFTADSS